MVDHPLRRSTDHPASGRPGDLRSPGAIPAVNPWNERGTGRTYGAFSFRALLTTALIAAAICPLAVFGGIVMAANLESPAHLVGPMLVAALAGGALFGLLLASVITARLTAPLRRITVAVERVASGEASPPLEVSGEDELARLAESHNRIAGEVQRRNHELDRLLTSVSSYSPSLGVEGLRKTAEADACTIYGFIDCRIQLTSPRHVPVEERIPGDPRPVRANILAGGEALGVLSGHLPATRSWERADQDLLDLFASEVGVALRNAELFGRIDEQNKRLLELDAAKDEFLRGVSHNLQTPLTSIRAYVDQLRAAGGGGDDGARDRRLEIVAEQTDRLTRLVRQLLTVTRIEAGVLRPQAEVMAVAPRIRKAWEALNATEAAFDLRDEARGWLTVADADQLDQVLWALLDNALKYGGRTGRVEVHIVADDLIDRLHVTIADHGPGVSEADRSRLFTRFTRGATQSSGDGTGLGLYVSRQLMRTMGGDLWLEPAAEGIGAAFTLTLPGEPPGDEA
jgi:two-component system sensor histidine kinase VicK